MDQDPTDIIPAERPARPEADPLMTLIAKAASNPKVDVDKLDQMLKMLERREDKAKEMAYVAALSAAQAEFEQLVKSKHVKFKTDRGVVDYWHAPYNALIDAIRPAFAKHGLTFWHETSQPAPAKTAVTCVMQHAAGHQVRVSLMADDDRSGAKNPHQGTGSTVTYLKRYTLEAAAGVASEDDDGRMGAGNDADTTDPTIGTDELLYLQVLMDQAGYSRDTIESWAGCKLEAMKVKRYEEAVVHLRMRSKK
jgi:hypothetical protein